MFHNRVVASEAGIPTGYRRNLAVESFSYNSDGSIQKLEYTRDGIKQVSNLNPFVRVEGETFATQSGIETERCENGGMNVTDTQDGDWIKVAGVDFGKGASKVSMMTAAGAQCRIELRVDSVDGDRIATVNVSPSRVDKKWDTATADVSDVEGVHDLYIKFVGVGDNLCKLDWWQFAPKR